MTDFKKINFYNFPYLLKRSDYEKTVELALNILKKNPYFVSLYLMNDDWLPGISDIDFVVVYENGLPYVMNRKENSFLGNSKYIIHDYNNYDRITFKNIRYIFPSKFDLLFIWGEKLKVASPEKELSDEEIKLLKASFVLDCLVNKVLLFSFNFQRNVDVNRALLFLYSFKYTALLIEEVTGRKLKNPFPERIKKLRLEWFSLDKKEQKSLLAGLIEEGLEFGAQLTEEFDIFLKSFFKTENFPKKLLFNPPNLFIKNSDKWNKKEYLKEMRQIRFKMPLTKTKLLKHHLIVPSSFFIFFNIYADFDGDYSNWFRNFLSPAVFDIKCVNLKRAKKMSNKRINSLNNISKTRDGKLLTKTTVQYGFNNHPLIKEKIKSKVIFLRQKYEDFISILRQTKR